MQPGLTRALPMAILGFLLASLVVIVLRGLQQLDPLWAPGPGFVLSAFTSAGFFVWGMGAFDPKMSVHGEHAEAEHHDETPAPRAILSGQIWTLLTLLVVILVPLMLFAAFGGVTLTMTADPLASTTAVGYFPVEWFGRDLLISELVVFVVFVLVMFVSLALTAGALGWLLVFLARSIAEVKAAPSAPLSAPALATGDGGVVVGTPSERTVNVRHVITFVILFVIFYLLFYYILIGLALPAFVPATATLFGQPAQVVVNALLSIVNAAVVAFLLVRPTILLHVVGRVAGWLVKLLRRIPVLFQR